MQVPPQPSELPPQAPPCAQVGVGVQQLLLLQTWPVVQQAVPAQQLPPPPAQLAPPPHMPVQRPAQLAQVPELQYSVAGHVQVPPQPSEPVPQGPPVAQTAAGMQQAPFWHTV